MTSTAADYVAEALAQAGDKRIYGVVRRSRSRPIYRAARSVARGRRIGLGIFRPDRDDRLVDPCARDLFLGGIAWLGSHGGGFSDIRFEGATVSAQQFAACRIIDEGAGYGLALEGISAAEVARAAAGS
jgi:hypothetical protein